jgi:hypothetical protein
VAFIALSAGAAVLARIVGLSGEPARSSLGRLLLAYSLGVLVAGLTRPDQVVHAVAALTAFAVVPLAAMVSRRPGRWIWFGLMMASFAAWPVLGFGLGERATVLVEVVWLLRLNPTPTTL